MKIYIDTKRVILWFGLIVILINIMNIAVQILRFGFDHGTLFGFYRVFDMNTEGNIPSFYSSVALLISAGLIAVIALHEFVEGNRFRKHWATLSGIFVFLALDESSELHELIVINLQPRYDLQGVFFFIWVIPYGILVMILGVMYINFLLNLPKKTRIAIVLSAVIFLTGAIGLEMVSSHVVSSLGGWGAGFDHIHHVILYSIEEPLEMIGIVVFIYALLDYIEKMNTGECTALIFGRRPYADEKNKV